MMYNVEQVVLALPGMMTRLSLFNQNVVYVEDALGWVLPILLDARPSWEVLEQHLSNRTIRNGLTLCRPSTQSSRINLPAKVRED